jgi:hypothetical protein
MKKLFIFTGLLFLFSGCKKESITISDIHNELVSIYPSAEINLLPSLHDNRKKWIVRTTNNVIIYAEYYDGLYTNLILNPKY